MSERKFIDKQSYFDLIEESAWKTAYDKEANKLVKGDPVGWSKTRIIITKAKTSGEVGIEVLRFTSDTKPVDEHYGGELARNPYAGIYLKAEEWAIVTKRINEAAGVKDENSGV